MPVNGPGCWRTRGLLTTRCQPRPEHPRLASLHHRAEQDSGQGAERHGHFQRHGRLPFPTVGGGELGTGTLRREGCMPLRSSTASTRCSNAIPRSRQRISRWMFPTVQSLRARVVAEGAAWSASGVTAVEDRLGVIAPEGRLGPEDSVGAPRRSHNASCKRRAVIETVDVPMQKECRARFGRMLGWCEPVGQRNRNPNGPEYHALSTTLKFEYRAGNPVCIPISIDPLPCISFRISGKLSRQHLQVRIRGTGSP